MHGENFSWRGQIDTMGKISQIIFKNLIITGQRVEGVLVAGTNSIYELVGDFDYEKNSVNFGGMEMH